MYARGSRLQPRDLRTYVHTNHSTADEICTGIVVAVFAGFILTGCVALASARDICHLDKITDDLSDQCIRIEEVCSGFFGSYINRILPC